MSDLISRNKMIEDIHSHINNIVDKDVKEVYESFIDFINRQPVAYDVERVVEELQEGEYDAGLIVTKEAIDIVKRGGVE